jgi:hypothetical protein
VTDDFDKLYDERFPSNEAKRPAHVHVEHGDGVAKFWLNPVQFESSAGMKSQELKRARELIEENAATLMEAWNERQGA